MADLKEIVASALGLSADERAALAEKLLASLDELDEEEAERLWAKEAERRLEEFRAGRARAAKSEDVAKRAAAMANIDRIREEIAKERGILSDSTELIREDRDSR